MHNLKEQTDRYERLASPIFCWMVALTQSLEKMDAPFERSSSAVCSQPCLFVSDCNVKTQQDTADSGLGSDLGGLCGNSNSLAGYIRVSSKLTRKEKLTLVQITVIQTKQ